MYTSRLGSFIMAGLVTVLSSCLFQGAIAQPPPPARSASGPDHWRDVLAPDEQRECETRCRSDGQYETCAAPLCAASAHPMLMMRDVSPRTAAAGDRIAIEGSLGNRRSDYVVALVGEREDRQRREAPRLILYHRLEVLTWNEQRVWARVHNEVAPGRGYGVVVLCNLTEDRRAAPVFKQCSNVVHIDVRNR